MYRIELAPGEVAILRDICEPDVALVDIRPVTSETETPRCRAARSAATVRSRSRRRLRATPCRLVSPGRRAPNTAEASRLSGSSGNRT